MMSLPYRLIALDVDGTLLNDDHELTKGTADAVKQAAAMGAQIVLCTGRGASQAFHLLEELGLSGILITHNGATTVHSGDRTLLHGFSYSMREAAGVIEYCRANGIHYDANTVYELYADKVDEETQAMYDKFNIVANRVEDLGRLEESCYKMTLFGTAEKLDRLNAEWDRIGCSLARIRSDICFIDVMHPQASKGNALRQLAEQLKVPREQILAIGNYYNDIDMLRFAGLGVAMANSPDEVKQAADEVTLSNNEDGVRAVLLKHAL